MPQNNFLQQLNNLKAKLTVFVKSSVGLSLFFFAFLASAAPQNSPLPDLGSADLVAYDQQTEQRLGRAFTSSLHAGYDINQNPIINHYIRQLGHNIASYSNNHRDFSFYVINEDSINAFAGPNGVIGIHTGLIKATQNEDELAAVIAHEISHVTQNHLSRRYEYASTFGNINSIATVLAAILVGIYDTNAAMATLMGGMGYNLQRQLHNSRMHETEADTVGIELLYQAGFDPHAMGGFFKRLALANNNNSFQVPEILRTHPVTDRRLAEAENRAAQYERQTSLRDPYDFELIKALAIQAHKINKSSLNKDQQCFVQSIQNKNIPNCLPELAFAHDKSNIYLAYYLQRLNEMAILTGHNPKPSSKKLEKIVNYKLDLYPNDSAVLINFAKLLGQDNKNKAIDFIQQRGKSQRYKFASLKLLSELYAKQNKHAYAYFYLAQANMEIGNIARANHYLEQTEKEIQNHDKNLKAELAAYRNIHHKLLINKDNKE